MLILRRRNWTPAKLPGLVLWLDASNIVGLNDGDAVTSWLDLSGTGNHATDPGTAGTRPHYKVNIINGLPVVRFDGGDFMPLTNAINLSVATCCVVATSGASSLRRILNTVKWTFLSSTNAPDEWGLGMNNNVTSGHQLTSAPRIMTTVIRNFNDVDFYDNGVLTNKTTGTAFQADNTRLGASSAPSQFFNGDLAGLVVTSGNATPYIPRLHRYYAQRFLVTLT